MSDQDLIDKYLTDSMSEDEQLKFDALKTDDPAFRKEVESMELLKQGIRLSKLQEKTKILQDLEQEINQKSEAKIVNHRFANTKILRVLAAGLILSISASIWLLREPEKDLYNDYNVHLPAMEIERGEDYSKEFSEAINYYNEKQFKTALNLFQHITTPSSSKFYTGICLMQADMYEEAIKVFEDYRLIDNTLPCEYYIALCYIQLENNEVAIAYLKRVRRSDTQYYRLSQELIELLKT